MYLRRCVVAISTPLTCCTDWVMYHFLLAPHEFTQIPFAVKALKIIIHDLQSGGESATIAAASGFKSVDVESDDGVR